MKSHLFNISLVLFTSTINIIGSLAFSLHSSSTLRQETHPRTSSPFGFDRYTYQRSNFLKKSGLSLSLDNNNGGDAEDNISSNCWNPSLRRIMGSVAVLGMSETALLTFEKLTGQDNNLCGADGSCSSVLTGPYATVPFTTDVPLSALGFVAYTGVALLALSPLLSPSKTNNENEDDNNRVALLALTTTMGTFSTYLMSLLFGVLHTSCMYCVASATLSWTLAVSAWVGGALPDSSAKSRKQAVQSSVAGFSTATIAALLLFVSVDVNDPSTMAYAGTNRSSAAKTSTLLASTASSIPQEPQAPPAITQRSSDRALELSLSLKSLDAKMYGAFWCSHCYDQKERLGMEAMRNIPYIECSKDGVNSQSTLCKSKDVPGFPTWEIGGKLFPGEMYLDELEDIVKDVKGITK
mmetsp:Transcript_10246/g.14492  ORF Transcript_10246/g.14492 Transcript_10246/m.14492 type:complete len:409 (-) Transcript_10246:79-1305(-)